MTTIDVAPDPTILLAYYEEKAIQHIFVSLFKFPSSRAVHGRPKQEAPTSFQEKAGHRFFTTLFLSLGRVLPWKGQTKPRHGTLFFPPRTARLGLRARHIL